MIRAAVFDLDGTLIDTIDDLTASMNRALNQCGYPEITRDQVRAYIGCGAYEFVRLAIASSTDDPDRIAACLATYRGMYDRDPVRLSKPFAGIREALADLKRAGIRLGVLSNKPDVATQAVIGRFFGPGCFDAVRGQREGFLPKPDPAAFLELLRELGVSPEEAVMIGDGEPDVLTAKNAGTRQIGVLWGYRNREELAAAGATVFAESPAAIKEILLENRF